MGIAAFGPPTSVGAVTISCTAASATVATRPSSAGGFQFATLTNRSTNDAYYSLAATSATTAVAATTNPSSGNNIILNRTSVVICTPPNTWISAITTAGQADLIFQVGTAGSRG